MISFKVDPSAWRNLEQAIARKVAEVVANTASIAYNTAIQHQSPYWSGQYFASWDVTFDRPSTVVLPNVGKAKQGKGASYHYARPLLISVIPNYTSPYSTAYVTNTSDHAYMIEYEGTPTHPDDGWKIAFHAKNQALAQVRLF